MGGSCGQLPVPSVGDLSNGGGRREAADGHIAAGDLHTPTSNLEQTTSFKKKAIFFRFFSPARGPGPARRRPDGPARCAAERATVLELIAQ